MSFMPLNSVASAQFGFDGLDSPDSGTLRISGDGLIIVGATRCDGVAEASLRTPTIGIIRLGNLPGGDSSGHAFAASYNGRVVVGHASSAGGTEAFRWTAHHGMVGLGDLPGAGPPVSDAIDVSADGSVVVGQSRRAWPMMRAFRWTAASGMVDLGCLPGGDGSAAAAAVTTDGQLIVGGSHSAVGEEAFRWTEPTGMVGLGQLRGGIGSRATAVSADGEAIVGVGTSATGFEAFRWTRATGMVGLGMLDGGPAASRAEAVSADGNVVVGIGSGAEDFTGEAFVWFPATGMLNLSHYLLAHGVTGVQGWRLIAATGVSADGRTIVGAGINPFGQVQAWVARIAVVTGDAPMAALDPVLATLGAQPERRISASGGSGRAAAAPMR